MGLWKKIKKFLFDPLPTSRISELEEGRVAVEGIVQFGEEGGIVSPVRGAKCVAFYYKALYLAGSRGGGFVQRRLREAEVYTPFKLVMEDGIVKAVPNKSDSFSAEEHRILTGAGYLGFKAVEDVILPGTRVRLWGNLKKKKDGELVVKFKKIEIINRDKKEKIQKRGKKKRE